MSGAAVPGGATPAMTERGRWRRELRKRRRSVPAGEARRAADAVADRLRHSALWQRRRIALYSAGDGEIDPIGIARAAWIAGKSVYLPVIGKANKTMHFAAWPHEAPLETNRFGIGEPADAGEAVERPDLILLPVVGWTERGFRLGMGGGYYDRFLASAGSAVTLGLAYECQCEPTLDALREEWDMPLDGVLTEQRLIRCDGNGWN